MSNLLNRLQTRQMPYRDVPICLNLNLLNDLDQANLQLVRASQAQTTEDRMVPSPAVREARAAIEAAKTAIRDASILIRITGVDRSAYNEYLLACPPRKGRNEQFDPTKFYMHVARETATYIDEAGAEHPISEEEWAVIDKEITDGEHDRIAAAVVEVNRTVGANGIDFFGSGSATTRDSFGISASPEPSASPRAASGVGSRKKSAAAKK